MKLLALAALTLGSISAQALPSELLVQVLQTPAVQNYTNGASITNVAETAVYRCMNCYDLRLTLQTPVGEQTVDVQTRSGIVPGVNILVTGSSK